jgi:hypothetical protein
LDSVGSITETIIAQTSTDNDKRARNFTPSDILAVQEIKLDSGAGKMKGGDEFYRHAGAKVIGVGGRGSGIRDQGSGIKT